MEKETKVSKTQKPASCGYTVLATVPCPECNGEGWYADHSLEHYHNSHDPDCSRYGCPVQVECEKCNGTGHCS